MASERHQIAAFVLEAHRARVTHRKPGGIQEIDFQVEKGFE